MANSIPFDALKGFRPNTRIIVGDGFSREELKDLLLEKRITISSHAIQSIDQFLFSFLETEQREKLRVATAFERESILRAFFESESVRKLAPLLSKRVKRRSFFQKLDRAIQSYRMSFAHTDEEEVILLRLNELGFENPIRTEILGIIPGLLNFLNTKGLVDLATLYELASHRIIDVATSDDCHFDKVCFYQLESLQPRERSFWSDLGNHVEVGFFEFNSEGFVDQKPKTIQPNWIRYHTLNDAAHELATEISEKKSWDDLIVLIPDLPEVRRTLISALDRFGIPLNDTRDPTLVNLDESVKTSVLPLRALALNYDRNAVIQYLRAFYIGHSDINSEINRIRELAIAFGRESYDLASFPKVAEILGEIELAFSGGKILGKWIETHYEFLNELGVWSRMDKGSRLIIEAVWQALRDSQALLDGQDDSVSVSIYLNLFVDRLRSQGPVADPVKNSEGLRVFRLSQASFSIWKSFGGIEPGHNSQLVLFGVPERYFSSSRVGDFLLNDRERDFLSSEFQVLSSRDRNLTRLNTVKEWIQSFPLENVWFYDAEYEIDGSERESLEPDLGELGYAEINPNLMGAADVFQPSFRARPAMRSSQVKINDFSFGDNPSVSASLLEEYSRCPFRALTRSIWKLEDIRDPEKDGWPDEKGRLLHLLAEKTIREDWLNLSEKELRQKVRATLKKDPIRGLIRATRIFDAFERDCFERIKAFSLKEKEYLERGQRRIFQLESREPLKIIIDGIEIKGRADRIDEFDEGLFIIDYKLSTSNPNGVDMREFGYRVQLPIYALACMDSYGKDVVGVQYVELSKAAGRTKGIFFEKYNGKESGKVTHLRRNSKSLFDSDPEAFWLEIKEKIQDHIKRLKTGIFDSRPTLSSECDQCFAVDLCGEGRRSSRPEGDPE